MAQSQDGYIEELKKEIAQQEADKKAVVAEFTELVTEKWDNEKIRDKFKELLPNAFIELKKLMISTDNDNLRLAIIKFVFATAMNEQNLSDPEKGDKAAAAIVASLMGSGKK